MTYRIGMLLLLLLIVLGGCQMGGEKETKKPSDMKEEDLPDVQAFDDEFTRKFLQTTEETQEGFYPFLSGTGKYKMDFPAGGVIDDRTYLAKKNNHEEVNISIEDDTGFGMNVIYYSNHAEEQLEEDLDRFKKRLGYDGDFEKLNKNDRTIYYAQYERYGSRTFVGYILNEKNMGAVELTYKIDCQDEKEDECIKNKQSDKNRAMKWMESVQFINDERDDDNHE